MIRLSNNFILSGDKYNWILSEVRVTPKMTYEVKTYHSNLHQVANKMMKLVDISDIDSLNKLADVYECFANEIATNLEMHTEMQTKTIPIGEDSKPKDWVKLGLSPSCVIEDYKEM